MQQKSIGEVLKTARESRGWTLLDVQQIARIQAKYLQALEHNDFGQIPDEAYTRSFLNRYAEVLELDADVLLDAYQHNRLVVYYEAGEEVVSQQELRRNYKLPQKRQNYLPLIYLLLTSCFILIFVSYVVHSRIQNQARKTPPSSYQVISSSKETEETAPSSSSTEPSSSDQSDVPLLIATGGGDQLAVTVSGASKPVTLDLSVTDVTSWISVSDTDLAGGFVLSPENRTVQTTLADGITETSLVLGVVQGVKVSIGGQELDTSALTSQTATIVITVE